MKSAIDLLAALTTIDKFLQDKKLINTGLVIRETSENVILAGFQFACDCGRNGAIVIPGPVLVEMNTDQLLLQVFEQIEDFILTHRTEGADETKPH